MRTETLAIVFTDIKGYTATTSSQSHQEQAKMLGRVERVIAPVVRAYNGRVIKSIGDAYMIVFDSPTEAVRCSTAIQDRLHQHNANTSADQAIHIRIAMNLGEVRVHRGDVFGEPVNIAARIESVTPADDIYLSEAIYLTMNRSDLPIEEVGEYELKGIPEPVTVFRVKKFAHLEEEGEEGDDSATKAQGLPFGGGELEHWKRVRWLRRAYMAMWIVGVIGLIGAGYLRYRPSSDYGDLVAAAQAAAERKAPQDVLAVAGRIPRTADTAEERAQVRPLRIWAAGSLIEKGELEMASSEVENLLAEDSRDPDAMLLHAVLLSEREEIKKAVETVSEALKLKPTLSSRQDLIDIVVEGYGVADARKLADSLVATHLKNEAIPRLSDALSEDGDRLTKKTIAARLDKLGAKEKVDWVQLAIDDLASTNCKVRKAAIARLQSEGDLKAVGPLNRIAKSKGCGAQAARKAAEELQR